MIDISKVRDSDFLSSFNIKKNNPLTKSELLLDYKFIHPKLDLTQRPETYYTLLGSLNVDDNYLCSIRKRLNEILKQDSILYIELNHIHSRLRLFFSPIKEYYIFLTNEDCFFCEYVEELPNSSLLKITNCYILKGCNWVKLPNFYIESQEVVAWY